MKIRARGVGVRVLGVALVAWLGMGASEATAFGAQFVQSPWAAGFDAGPTSYPTQPDYRLPSSSSHIFGVSSGVNYSLDQCILLTLAGSCRSTAPLGNPYSAIVSVSFDAASLPQPILIPAEGLLFFLSGLNRSGSSGAPAYSTDAVSIVLDPQPISGFDFTPLESIVWSPSAGQSFYYLGFRLFPDQLQATLRYDVSAQLAGGTPSLATNASYGFTVVPEPATGLLLGFGVLALALARHRE